MQFPEGLKEKASEISAKLEKEGNEVFISASPCFGACDLALAEAEAIGAEKIVHYGHASFPIANKSGITIEFVEWNLEMSLTPVLKKAIEDERFKKCETVALVTTVQHVKKISEMRKLLEENGKRVFVGKPGPKAKYAGQVLGCDPGAAISIEKDADCILYVGGGNFHPIGIAVKSRKQILVADPYSGEVKWMDNEISGYEKKRKGLLNRALQAKNFGIIVSTKPGQQSLEASIALKKALAKVGKKAEILVANFVSPEPLMNFRTFDAYINTACPRISIDDSGSYDKPMINLDEALLLVKLLKVNK